MHDHHHANGHHHHSHDHEHHHDAGISGYGLAPAPGHNAAARMAQWQEPHRHEEQGTDQPEPDFDLIEASFVENFPKASDPTSFLRLARIPFVGKHPDGRTLRLLRVEYEQATDVGALMPQLGGLTHRHDPLPAALVSTRQRLRFAYFDGEGIVHLSLAGTRGLSDEATDDGD
jgi:hypothetical protein